MAMFSMYYTITQRLAKVFKISPRLRCHPEVTSDQTLQEESNL